jgi:DNA-binding CsgD family transcriptional regulator/N-acetylneuraminic acid mutarotase
MPEPNETLSERELEILRLVATGAANKEIARQLVISPNTVKVHLRNIFAKIGVASRTEATLYALNLGLVKSPAPEAPAEEDTLGAPAGSASAPSAEEVEEALPEGRPARPSRSRQLGLAILAVLALVIAGVTALRLLDPFSPPNTTAAQATLPSEPETRWTGMAGLPSPRRGMGAVAYENAFYLIAGRTAQGVDGAALRYRLADAAWETLAAKPTPVADVQAALLGEKIYVPGGCLADGSATTVLEVFDPRQNTWERKAALPRPACAYALATYEGQLYLFGGKRGSEYLDEIYLYDPQEDRWQERRPLRGARAYAGAAVVGGKILLIGGYDGKQALALNEAYFPNRETAGEEAWEDYAPLPEGRYAMGIAELAGLVYLVGGTGDEGAAEPAGLQYLPQTDQWFAFESAPEPPGASPAVLAAGNFLHTLGGENQAGLSAFHQSYQAIFTISVPIINENE